METVNQEKPVRLPLDRADLIGLFDLASRAEMSFIETNWFNELKMRMRPVLFPPNPPQPGGQNSPQTE